MNASRAAAPVPVNTQPVLTRIVEFLDGFALDDAPQAVLERATTVVVDTVACIVGGTTVVPGAAVVEAVADMAASGPCAVLGTDVRTDCAHAAYANSYLADVLDFEDTLVSHPSAAVVPSVLAVGQHTGASGRDVLRAVVAAYEVGVRVAQALMPSAAHGREVAVEFYWKSLASAVAAGSLLGLRGEQWETALGYAASATPAARRGGLDQRPLTWLKTNFAGQTEVGVRAAFLARRGFRTNRGMLDGSRTVAGLLGSDHWDPDSTVQGLGQRWTILDTTFKVYPCCLYLHSVAQAVGDAVRSAGPGTVSEMELRVPRVLSREFGDQAPCGIIDAQFSAPFVATMSALGVAPGSAWWNENTLSDPQVTQLMRRVRVVEDTDLSDVMDRSRRVVVNARVTFADGRSVDASPQTFAGSRLRPMTADQLEAKFVDLLGSAAYDPVSAAEIMQHFSNIARVEKLDELLAVLTHYPADMVQDSRNESRKSPRDQQLQNNNPHILRA